MLNSFFCQISQVTDVYFSHRKHILNFDSRQKILSDPNTVPCLSTGISWLKEEHSNAMFGGSNFDMDSSHYYQDRRHTFLIIIPILYSHSELLTNFELYFNLYLLLSFNLSLSLTHSSGPNPTPFVPVPVSMKAWTYALVHKSTNIQSSHTFPILSLQLQLQNIIIPVKREDLSLFSY